MRIYIINYLNIDNEKSQATISANSEKEAQRSFEIHMGKIGEGYRIIDIEVAEIESEEIL